MLERLGLKLVMTIVMILIMPVYLFLVLLAVGYGVYFKVRYDSPAKEWWVDEGIGRILAEIGKYFLYPALFGEIYEIDWEAFKLEE